ncbi:hypothetical protein KDI_03210 [Dictyobacter arantiisoli]|uniref:Zinc-ribbon domain-containing protein n=2 Tax=Dictyobacter arantiisoli TaxID=2014874 RepID=A0A5A5T5X2_9CHLR|nr:hypothetical protein KDI_03210 [Dictyobacter arantiisoli]
MLCPSCQAPVEADSVFCGHCGSPLPPLHLRDLGVSDDTRTIQRSNEAGNSTVSAENHQMSPMPHLPVAVFPLTPAPLRAISASSSTPEHDLSSHSSHPPRARFSKRTSHSSTGRNLVSVAIILVLLGIGIAAGVLALWQNKNLISRMMPVKDSTALPQGISGRISFSGSDAAILKTDSLAIHINGLHIPAGNAHYEAWMLDLQDETRIQSLGPLIQTGEGYTLNFTDPNGNILKLGNRIEVSLETTHTTLPTGHVVLSATLPPLALVHIRHLLVSYPDTPHYIGLLDGLQSQAAVFYQQSQLLGITHNKTNIQCIARNLITIIDGKLPTTDTPNARTCNARQITQIAPDYGLLGTMNNGYVHMVGVHASLAATQADATDTIRHYAQQVILASDNLQGWYSILDQDAQSLLKNPDDPAKIHDITSLADHALNGFDANHDGNIAPQKNEAGVMQAYLYGQSMATMFLSTPGA